MIALTVSLTVLLRFSRLICSWISAMRTLARLTSVPAPRSSGWVMVRPVAWAPLLSPPLRVKDRDQAKLTWAPVGAVQVAVGDRVTADPAMPALRVLSTVAPRFSLGQNWLRATTRSKRCATRCR